MQIPTFIPGVFLSLEAAHHCSVAVVFVFEFHHLVNTVFLLTEESEHALYIIIYIMAKVFG